MRFRTIHNLCFLALLLYQAPTAAPVAGQSDAGTLSSPSLSDTSRLRFSPRDDERAPADLKELRWILSQIEKEKGIENPLADYVEKPSTLEDREKRAEWKQDDEAHVIPKLFKNATPEYASPDLQPNLNSVLRTESNRLDNTVDSASQRARVEAVYDPCYVPLLRRPAIPAKFVSSNPDRTAFQPEIPYNSQPTTLPNFGGGGLPQANPATGMPSPGAIAPVLPNGGVNVPPPGLGGTATAPPSYNPPAMGALPYASPSTSTPVPTPNNLGALPANPTFSTPSPSGYVNTPLSGPGLGAGSGVVMPAPPATYNPATGLNSGGVPATTYAPGGGIVNGQPFVNPPPCQKDARYMVSPTVYRQSTGCNTCGDNAYAPITASGSPFSYTPATYFPGAFNGYASQYRPLIGLGQDVRQAQLGRGIIGQPVAYMPSQPLRNVLRYLFP